MGSYDHAVQFVREVNACPRFQAMTLSPTPSSLWWKLRVRSLDRGEVATVSSWHRSGAYVYYDRYADRGGERCGPCAACEFEEVHRIESVSFPCVKEALQHMRDTFLVTPHHRVKSSRKTSRDSAAH